MLIQDVRHAIRKLLRHPVYATAATATLGLGVAAVVSVFSLINAIHFRPLPIPEIERLVSITEHHSENVCAGCTVGTSLATLEDWISHSSSIDAFGAYTYFDAHTVVGSDGPRRVHGAAVSATLFPMLGFRPMLGRFFGADDDRVGASPVVVVSHRLWQGALRGDSGVVGRAVSIDGASRTIVGVMPPAIDFPYESDVWLPLRPARANTARDTRNVYVIGRVAAGQTLATAEADLARLSRGIAEVFPKTNAGWSVSLAPLRQAMTADYADRYPMFALTVAFVLLVVCANVAGIELARGGERGNELALRLALGASRTRLVRQLLLETTIVASAGSAIGTIGAVWGVDLVTRLYPHLPYWVDVGIDGRVLLVSLACTLITGALTGIAPALTLTKQNLGAIYAIGARVTDGRGVRRWQSTTIVAQVAVTTMLLASAAASLQMLARLREPSLGWDPHHGLVAADLQLTGARYATASAQQELIRNVIDRAGQAPGITAAAYSLDPALPRGEGPGISTESGMVTNANVWRALGVTRSYFETLRLPLVAGRSFTAGEEREGLSAVVSEAVADSLWPRTSPLGRRFKFGAPGGQSPWLTVVGVAGNTRAARVSGWQETRYVYVPLLSWPATEIVLFARDGRDGTAALSALRSSLASVDAAQPLDRAMTVARQRAMDRQPTRLNAIVLFGFGAFALILAAVGLSVLVIHSVHARLHELGVRITLGASSASVIHTTMQRAAQLAVYGVIGGCVGAVLLSRVASSVVRGFAAPNATTIVVCGALMGAVALVSSYLPARRAAAIDPAIILRSR